MIVGPSASNRPVLTRHRRHHLALPVAALLAIGWAALATSTSPAGSSIAAAAGNELTITSQAFNLPADGNFEVTVALPDGVDGAELGDKAVLTVTSFARMITREAFLLAVQGDLQCDDQNNRSGVGDELGCIDDEFEISLDPADADPNVTRPSTDTLTLTVPTDAVASIRGNDPAGDAEVAGSTSTSTTSSTTSSTTTTTSVVGPTLGDVTPTVTETPEPLQFEGTGVHPVQIRLVVNGRQVAQTATFVHVLGGETPGGEMSIGLLMGQINEPTVADDGTVSATAADVEELGRLADTLAAIDAVPAAVGLDDPDIPRGVFVQPATLQSVVDDGGTLAARLTPGLVRSDIISAPRLPFEPSAAAAAGQHQRYTQLLTKGEDLLAQLLPRTDIGRTVQIVGQPFSRAAADLQRSAGARLMVMDFAPYLEAEGGNGLFTDTSQLISMALPDNTTVPTAIIDPHISRRLEEGVDDPLRTSIQIVADLLVVAQSVDDEGGIASRHGMMLARSDLGVPDAALMGQLVSLLATTEGLRLVAPKELVSNVVTLLRPGGSGEVTITLPDQAGADLSDRVDLIEQISGEIFAFASMLSDGAQQVEQWGRVLDALPSTAVDDQTAAAMVAGLRKQFDVYRTGIQGPAPFTFTLTGRSNTVTFSLTNTTDTELKVRVRLSSPKLTFPDGDEFEVLPPGAETEINVRAEALSNGKSSVFLQVYPSAENSDIQLMPEVVLTARVSSLAGLGQLLTGAGLLLLVTWWGRHWQQARRKRIAAGHVGRHPASNGNGGASNGNGTSGAGDELAPDAAASSLPPS